MFRKLMKKHQNEKGFTLIELMIVIAIIGILAAVAIPNYLSYRDNAACSAVESDVQNLATAMSGWLSEVPGRTAAQYAASAEFTALQGAVAGTTTLTITSTANPVTMTGVSTNPGCAAVKTAAGESGTYTLILGQNGSW